jgi:sensor domain CHASE-containing protein
MKVRHLRTKLSLVVVPIVLLGAAGFYAASNMVLLPGFQKLENESAINDARRAVDTLSSRVGQINQKASDWSNWDDAYAFVNDHNKKFIAANLGNQALANLGIDYALFYNANHQLVEMKHVQIDDPKLPSAPLDPGMQAILAPDSALLRHASATDAHTGVLNTPEGIVILVSRPILTSQGQGPIRGSLVFAQILDAPAQQQLADLTHLKLEYVPASPTHRGSQWVSLLNNMDAQAFATIPDIFGQPTIAVRVDLKRTISQQGRLSLDSFLLAALLVGLLIVVSTALLLNMVIVKRIRGLSSQLGDISGVQDAVKVVRVSGSDEIALLGTTINDLLKRLHDMYDLQQTNSTLELKVSERTKELADHLEQAKRLNSLMIDRELRMKELKQQNAKLREKSGEDS